jgi:hypothetical protein
MVAHLSGSTPNPRRTLAHRGALASTLVGTVPNKPVSCPDCCPLLQLCPCIAFGASSATPTHQPPQRLSPAASPVGHCNGTPPSRSRQAIFRQALPQSAHPFEEVARCYQLKATLPVAPIRHWPPSPSHTPVVLTGPGPDSPILRSYKKAKPLVRAPPYRLPLLPSVRPPLLSTELLLTLFLGLGHLVYIP